MMVAVFCGLSGAFLLADVLWPLPNPAEAGDFARLVVARDGTPLRAFADSHGVWRYPVQKGDVSPRYLQALLGYEDRWFAYHPGVNPLALVRAWWLNHQRGKIVSGGSTLTMQVARLLVPHQRSYGGKLSQIFRALQLEYHYSKTEILEIYLNRAPFGGPLEGIAAASFAYLGKPPKELSRAEAALLAVLPQAPSRFRPDRFSQQATVARDKVLQRLASLGVWSAAEVGEAKKEVVAARSFRQPMLAPLLARRLKDQVGYDRPLVTTIDPELQSNLADYLAGYMQGLPEATSAGVLVVENSSLAVRAYLGSADFLDGERFGHVDMIQATRSPGSTLKPFLYGFALDQGLIHSHSLLADAPRLFGSYRPENFSSGFVGPVSVAAALQRSLNVPAIQVLESLGPRTFTAKLAAAGVRLQLPQGDTPNLAVVLGGAGTSLEQLVAAYTSFARQGLAGRLRFLEGEVDQENLEQRVMSPGAAWIIRRILAENKRPDNYRTAAITRPDLAWKTGTSFGFRDTWAMGITPRYTIGVWVGRPDGTPIPGHYGAVTAAPLLFAISDALAKPGDFFQGMPASVTEEVICWPLGVKRTALQDDSLCHQRHQAWILDGNVPPTLSDQDERDWLINPIRFEISQKNRMLVPADCDIQKTAMVTMALWPKGLEPWIGKEFSRRQIPAVDPACRGGIGVAVGAIKITGLAQGAQLYFGSGAHEARVSLDAIGGLGKRYWFVDGRMIGSSSNGTPLEYHFAGAGEFQVVVIDEQGNSDLVEVAVHAARLS
ncbi:MAG: penicillin-binding protein 1C [Proteobacteria bacterium]|nr:penicillin-binding protein 1C [Pseudomonadota bacterium]MBU1641586.1 penicillin-binding protein 1C [Pseudomonadota bacterium]